MFGVVSLTMGNSAFPLGQSLPGDIDLRGQPLLTPTAGLAQGLQLFSKGHRRFSFPFLVLFYQKQGVKSTYQGFQIRNWS